MIVKKRVFLSFVLILITQLLMTSQSKYYTYLNDFSDFRNNSNKIVNNVLVETNNFNEAQFNLINYNCDNAEISIAMRIANKNNIPGKTYKIYDKNNTKHKVNNPNWGLVWNYIDSLNYKMIKLSGHNSMLHDLLDERSLLVEIVNVYDGNFEILKTQYFKKGVDLYDGYNNIVVKSNNGYAYLYIGNKHPILIEKIKERYGKQMKIGYFIGPGSNVELEKIIIKRIENKQSKLVSGWRNLEINNYLNSDSIENIEGIWTYLDRNINETNLKLGGKYNLAIIKDKSGSYNILYYDGAVVNHDEWSCGMLKGRLYPTRFKNNYDLLWYDSSFEEINDDTYAIIDDNSVLTLFFPREKGQIRFVKHE